MSKVAIKGNASGTGTFTLEAPNSNTDRTLVLPDEAGTVLTDTGIFDVVQGYELIASATASASTSLDFTSIDSSSYSAYRLVIDNLLPGTNGVNLLLRFSNSGTFAASGYTWQIWRWTTSGSAVNGQSASGTGIALDAAGADNMANVQGGSWMVDIFDCSQSGFPHRVNFQGYYRGSTNLGVVGNGYPSSTSPIDGIRLILDGGTITSGDARLYGLRK